MSRNENRLFVVLSSFLMVWIIEYLDAAFYDYYTGLTLTSLIIVYLSARKDDAVLLLYGFVQLTMMCFYVSLFTSLYDISKWLIYYSPLNLSIIVLSLELAIIAYSGGACVRLAYSRFINGLLRRVHFG